MITTNQVYKDIIALIQAALDSQKIKWQILKAYQQTIGGHKPPYVLVHRLLSTNYGWQYGEDKAFTVNNVTTYKHTENQKEKQTFQIDFVYNRTANEDKDTITGTDVARIVSSWFMSDTGIAAAKAKGYEMLRISEVYEEYYKEVSREYQVAPHFKIDFLLTQTFEQPAQLIGAFSGEVHEVEQLKNL